MAKKIVHKSNAPYNFIGLDNFILDRYKDESQRIYHDKYYEDLNTGYIDYDIETITPLHISQCKMSSEKSDDKKSKNFKDDKEDKVNRLFKNPQGKYVIPANTIRGMTRFNASIFSFSSVINEKINKYEIANRKFYYRTYASKDRGMSKWYMNKVGQKTTIVNGYKSTVLEKVEAGYIRKQMDGYVITPAVKLGNKSYASIHELVLRKKGVRGISYLYEDGLEKEDYKKAYVLRKKRIHKYSPYIKEIRYNTNGEKPSIDANGKYKGYLANSNYIDGKVHHYLIFEEDKNSISIEVTKEQAELYKDDLEYTQKLNASKSIKSKFEYYALPKEGEVKPIFYVKENEQLIFGFTPYLRLPADGDIYDGVPESHRNYTGTDFVDSIFGTHAFRSKVSFIDAICNSPTPKISNYKMVLGEPKASWYKGYLKQRKDGELESYCTDDYKIRGRKIYWMKESADIEAMKLSLPRAGKIDRISTEMECYNEKTNFLGRIRFENLSDEELGLLLYSLKQGDTEGLFNLGMGKPYGLGKCKISISRLVLNDIKLRYKSFRSNPERDGDIEKYIAEFKKYVVEHYKVRVNDVNEIESYKEFNMSKTILKNANTRYMNVTEFKDRAELPTLEEAIKGETISNKMDSEDNKNLPQNNKGQGNKNSSNRDSNYNRNDNRGWKRDNKNNKDLNRHNKNTYKSSENTNLNTNAFDKLKDLKFNKEDKDI